MNHRPILALVSTTLLACSSQTPVPVPDSCRISTQVTVAATPEEADAFSSIQRAGDGFLLTHDAQTPWARVSKDGVLGPIAAPPEGAAFYRVLATVGKDAPADQIIAIDHGLGQQLVAMVLDEQTGLWGPSHPVLTAMSFGQVVQFGMASSFDGRRAMYVHGNRVVDDPQAVLLGGDAERRADPIVVETGPDHHWKRLAAIPTATAAALGVVEERDGSEIWRIVELDAEGARVFEASVDITDEIETFSKLSPTLTAVTQGGFATLLSGSGAPPIVVAVDRATFADDGATRVSLGEDEEPALEAQAFAAMNGGYAVYFTGGAAGSKPIRFFDASGEALVGGVDLPASIGSVGRMHSAPGTLGLSFRDEEKRWGWLEVTCGGE